ncbi:MAG: hypothetical protein LBT71_02970 [Azoarcus sp.]|jgi:hypothetical protein|nr:hypothetical protein [Azoarcus sp.]
MNITWDYSSATTYPGQQQASATQDNTSGMNVAQMTNAEKIGEAMKRSLPHLPEEAQDIVKSLLKPETLAIIVGTLVVWAGSHFFGFGEIVDIILLGVGFVVLGFAVFEGACEFYDFADVAINAKKEKDLELAGQHFARAVTLLGISTVQALLLRGSAKAVAKRGVPTLTPRIRVGPPPPSGVKPTTTYMQSISGGGNVGWTDAYGNIVIDLRQPLTQQKITLYHELVHRFFSPHFGPLRQLRAELGISGYQRSAFLRYIEEALAEGYGQLRVNGLTEALSAIRFPINEGYVTVSQMMTEGQSIGAITLGGDIFWVSVSIGQIPE